MVNKEVKSQTTRIGLTKLKGKSSQKAKKWKLEKVQTSTGKEWTEIKT
jgi:hypothetical protein